MVWVNFALILRTNNVGGSGERRAQSPLHLDLCSLVLWERAHLSEVMDWEFSLILPAE